MPTRTSIELYPEGCRLAEVHVSSSRDRAAGAAGARVRAFAAIPRAGEANGLSEALATARGNGRLGREAWVTIWGLRSAQQFLRLPPATPTALEALAAREARKEIAAARSRRRLRQHRHHARRRGRDGDASAP